MLLHHYLRILRLQRARFCAARTFARTFTANGEATSPLRVRDFAWWFTAFTYADLYIRWPGVLSGIPCLRMRTLSDALHRRLLPVMVLVRRGLRALLCNAVGRFTGRTVLDIPAVPVVSLRTGCLYQRAGGPCLAYGSRSTPSAAPYYIRVRAIKTSACDRAVCLPAAPFVAYSLPFRVANGFSTSGTFLPLVPAFTRADVERLRVATSLTLLRVDSMVYPVPTATTVVAGTNRSIADTLPAFSAG